MRRKNERFTDDADRVVKDIKRQTRRRFSAEEKIRIVLAGLRGEDSIAELCCQEGIAQSQYYSWSKEFMEAGKKRLAGLLNAYGDQETRLQDNPTERSAIFRFLFSCDDVGDVCF